GVSKSVCDAVPTAPQCLTPSPPPPPPPLLTGTNNYILALANDTSMGTVTPPQPAISVGTGTIDAAGKVTSFTQGGTNTLTGGSYPVSGNDGTVAWGTFTSGTITGGGAYSGTMPGGSNLYYVAALPNVTLPTTGTFTYTPLPGGLANSGGFATLTSATVT